MKFRSFGDITSSRVEDKIKNDSFELQVNKVEGIYNSQF